MTLLSFSFPCSHSSGGQPGLLTHASRGWQAHRVGWQTLGHVPVFRAAEGALSLPCLLSLVTGLGWGHVSLTWAQSALRGQHLNELKHPRMSRAAFTLTLLAQSLAEWLRADPCIPGARLSLTGDNLPLETSQHDGVQSSQPSPKPPLKGL